MSDNRTTELLRKLLDERGVEHYDGTESTLWLKDEHGYRASADELSSGRLSVHIWCDTPEQAIAATLGDGEYESRMDELLCRLTNGKWSKSRSYSVDFMVSCVDEAYDDAALGGGECEAIASCTDEKTLLPCPMCGSAFVQVRWIGFTYTHNGAFSAGYRGECCDCGLTTMAFDDEAEAIEAWNARAELESGTCEFIPFADEDWSEPNAVRGVCSKCSALMYGKDNYCSNCGRKVMKR